MDEVMITIEQPYSADAALLIARLSAELAARYDFADDGSGAFTPADVDVPGGAFVLARIGGRPVGCGALRPLEPGVGEIKRMFVAADVRGQGIARRILQELETAARTSGYAALRLETGVRQPEAIRLYEAAGYGRILCYGMYASAPGSVCFEKQL